MSKSAYMPQLNTLRAFAVIGVAWHHWAPESLQFGLPWASGVQLFFVLSGFLITGILLDCREAYKDESLENKKHILRNFYIRRFLRIFPIYYVVLCVAIIFNISDLREHYLWYIFYLSNYYFIQHGAWHGPVSHFWTLAVEEQFYILWPFIVLFLPKRWLFSVFIFFILMAPIFRIYTGLFFPEIGLMYIATPGSFDSLGLGALLALELRRKSNFAKFLINYMVYILISATFIYFITRYINILPWPFNTLRTTILSISFACVIYFCSVGVKGKMRHILDNKVLQYLGKISYGLYILHFFASLPTALIMKTIPLFEFDSTEIKLIVKLFIYSILTILGASFSWHFFEKPINNLKKKFPYKN